MTEPAQQAPAQNCVLAATLDGAALVAVVGNGNFKLAPAFKQALQALPEASFLVYISCNPATWARDTAYLTAHGFAPVAARMLNQFARTAHLEVVSVLERRSA